MKVAIITTCPTGIANSIIAAGLLEKAAGALGWEAQIECHSLVGEQRRLTREEIDAAELVVVTGDGADMGRFAGKPLYQAPTAQVLANPQDFLQQAKLAAKPYVYVAQAAVAKPTAGVQRIVAITACPTGVAHTFMAAEAIEEEAKKRGHWVKVETRGSVGAKNALTAEEIAAANLVVIAADIEVDLARFAGKRLYKTSTGAALKKTAQELDTAFATATVWQGDGKAAAGAPAKAERTGVYKHLMTGVSHMLPLVVAGGLCIALSFIFGIKAFEQEGTLAWALMKIGGGSAFALMVPVLAGYIAFSIADRPGLAPGLIGGMLASSLGAGFLGGIVAGFLAGYSAKLVADKVKLPQTMEALKPILIIPLVASLITGLIMIFVVGGPVSAAMTGLTNFLQNMGSANAVLLGILLGAMMCFDLGGPVNKAAYTFGVGLLASQSYLPMAAIMAAGMVPPLGMGLATLLARSKFTESEREGGLAAMVLGLCFISEGAIPFAARDPMRVIPCTMLGGAVTGALSMWFGAKLMAPHGGLFVVLIPNAISPVFPYLLAIVVGTAVTGVLYALLKPRESVAANGAALVE